MMKLMRAAVVTIAFFIVLVTANITAGEKTGAFSPSVDSKGSISLPTDFRSTWAHLGTWVVTSTAAAGLGLDQTGPGTGTHSVYTQSASLKAYKKDGTWPDGAMLILEVRAMTWDDLPTGHVIVEGDVVKWLVMIKDAKGRFPKNPNWGDGWGWALFKPAGPKINASTNYKEDCLGCHEPAKASDRVFIQGYPTLR
ncbi:MAG: cytochrome P460 family protein [Nitrospirota bacterium]